MDMGQYNTINLQEALAASMRDVFAVDREEVKTASPEQEEPDLMKNQQTVYAAENGNGEYQEDISRVLEESDQWDAQATGQLDTEETKLAADAVDAAESVSVQPTQSTPQVYADVEPTLPVASSSEACSYVAEPVNAQPEAPILAAQPAPEQTPAVTDPADAGIKNIVAPYDRNILRNVYPHFMQRINGAYGHHVILSCDSRKFMSFLEKLHGQLVAHGILGIHPRDLSVIGLICRLDEHMILFSLFFKLADKALHTLGSLPLPSGKWRRDKCHIRVPQIKKMSGHQPSYHCVVLIDSIYRGCFFLVADDDQRCFFCDLFYLMLEIRMRIAGIDDPCRPHGLHHTEIFFFQPRIALGVADKYPISLLIGHSLDSLKQQYIIGTGECGTENNDQLFFSVSFVFPTSGKLIAKLSGRLLHPLHSFSRKRNIIFPVQHHGYRCLGNSCACCHIR